MEVTKAISLRRSVRDFEKRDLPEGMINKLADALIRAPSAGNLQSRKFYFVRDGAVRKSLAAAAMGQAFIAESPLVVVGCTDSRISDRYGDRGLFLYSVQDVSVSIMCMMLTAVDEGLGSVWVGAFHEDEVSRVLDMPDSLRPVALVPVGYPAKIPSAPPRVSREEAVVVI
jgi:nitroreductase